MPYLVVKCRHCGRVLERPPRGRETVHELKFITCSRCEGRRSPQVGDVLRAEGEGFRLGDRGDYRAEVESINERTRTARIRIDADQREAIVRVPYDAIGGKR